MLPRIPYFQLLSIAAVVDIAINGVGQPIKSQDIEERFDLPDRIVTVAAFAAIYIGFFSS